jgi:hypothetical protein
MLNFLIIFACSLLSGNTGILHECRVTLSDALPIQFWSASCDTFNEKEVDGVFSRCFCQPFNCDDEIVFQFEDSANTTYNLVVIDSNDDVLYEVAFSKVTVITNVKYRYYLALTPRNVDICDAQVQFRIERSSESILSYTDGDSTTGWENSDPDATPAWRVGNFRLYSSKFGIGITDLEQGDLLDVSIAAKNFFLELNAVFFPGTGGDDFTIGTEFQIVNFGSFDTSPGETVNNFLQTVEIEDDYTGSPSRVLFYAKVGGFGSTLKITDIKINGSYGVQNPSFEGSFSPWSSVDELMVGYSDWIWNESNESATTVLGFDDQSNWLQGVLTQTVPNGNPVEVVIVIVAPLGEQISVGVSLWDGSTNDSIGGDVFIATGDEQTITISDTAAVNGTHVRISVAGTTPALFIEIRQVSVLTGVDYIPFEWTDAYLGDDNKGYGWNFTGTENHLEWPDRRLTVNFFSNAETNEAYKLITIPSGAFVEYALNHFIDKDAVTTAQVNFTVEFRNGDEVVQQLTQVVTMGTGTSEVTGSLSGDFVATGAIDRVVLIANNVGSTEIVDFGMDSISISSSVLMAKSDCVDIKEDHKETTLITYSNNRPFASLNSSVGTPDHAFNLRIPAVFFKERFPEESEVIELSNSRSIQQNAQVKAQRFLNVGPMPFYMHRKAKLALTFQTVTIDRQDWVKEEAYEVAETKRTHPLSKAQCWLTEKDTIYRNVL